MVLALGLLSGAEGLHGQEKKKTELPTGVTPPAGIDPQTAARLAQETAGAKGPGETGEIPGANPDQPNAEPAEKKKAQPPAEERATLSAFERQLQAYSDPLVGAPVLQFGYDVFSRPQPGAVDTPVGPDYVLGTSDSLVVSLWGNLVDQDYRVTIDREGEVRLPQVGIVPLKGLTLRRAEEVLRTKFDQFFKNYNMEVRLGRLRDMPVHVIGRVASPGRVRVTSVASLFDALAAAGGVTKDGTLRKVLLRKQGQAPREIDLYGYLIEGDLSVDVSLSANDVIVVPPVGARVAITGRVLRPAIYEVKDAEIAFEALLAMAGGYARLANRQSIQIESQSPQGLTIHTMDLAATAPGSIRLRDGDVVLVGSSNPKLENVVYVAGNVAMPGRYAYREGMRVSDVLTDQALIDAGFWLRRSLPGAADAETPLPEPFLDYALIRRILEPTQQEARIAFNLGKAILEKDPAEDQLLKPQDTIVVFPKSTFVVPQMVFISGAVNKPADYRFYPGMKVRDLVRMAGGLLPEAQLSEAVLIRTFPDQSGVRFENIPVSLAEAMAGDEKANLPLQQSDALSIKVVADFKRPYRVQLSGELRHPGTYTVIPGERLSDLLKRAGGFTKDAYLPAAQFHRESVRQLQQQRIDESLQRLELETKMATQKFAAEAAAVDEKGEAASVATESARIDRLIATIRATPAKGRMVIRVGPPEILAGTPDDLELAEGDRLVVPRQPQEVNVVGAVFNQTAIIFQKGLLARDYLQDCGGPTDSADTGLIYVIRVDGSADSAQSARRDYRWDSTRGRYSRGNLLGSELYPGDTLVVPYDVKPQISSLGLTKTVTQILFQTALATGVIVALL